MADFMRLNSSAVGSKYSLRVEDGMMGKRDQVPDQEKRNARPLEAINKISRKIAATLDLDTVIQQVSTPVQQYFGYDVVQVFLLNRKKNELVVKGGAIGYAERTPPEHSLKIGEGIIGWVAQTGETLIANDVSQEPRFHYSDHLAETRAELAIPLKVGDQAIGVLDIKSARLNAFGQEKIMLLESLADEVAVAVENERLYHEFNQKVDELARLQRVTAGVNSTLVLEDVLQLVVESAVAAVPAAETGSLFLMDENRNLILKAGHGLKPSGDKTVCLRWGEGYSGWVAREGQPLILDNVPEDPRAVRFGDQVTSIKSAVVVPLQAKGKIIGTLCLDNRSTYAAFDESGLQLLQTFADQAAIAIENARLYAETSHRLRELDALNRIATSITSTLDLERVLDLTMQELKDLLGVEVCSLMLLDEQTDELVFKVSLGPGAEQVKRLHFGSSQGIAGWVAREGQPALVLDVRSDPRWYSDIDHSTGFTTKSILAVPLKSKEKVIGVIEAINKVQGIFTADDQHLLDSISMVVTTAIENARLFGELDKAYQEMTESRAQILESRNTLRALFDGIPDIIFILDQDLNIRALNQAAAANLGETPQNFIGKRCYETLFHTGRSCDSCPAVKTFHTGKPFSTTRRSIGKSGTTREWELYTYPLDDAEKVVDRVIYIRRDISEKRKMEATLVQSAKLSAVGELAAGVAHEISNPMTAVIGNAQMLLRTLDPSDPRYQSAQLIERAGLRADKVVRNLLNFSRQEEYGFAPTDLNASIDEALSLIAYQLEREEICVIKNFAAKLPPISASVSHLQTVWTNLLLNAQDAILAKGQRGRIQIRTRWDKTRRAVEAIFTDSGCGIAEKDLPRVFDPFFTTKPQGKGTGLGLYISYAIVAQHHGTIQAQSRVGKGSTFVVTLPLERQSRANDG